MIPSREELKRHFANLIDDNIVDLLLRYALGEIDVSSKVEGIVKKVYEGNFGGKNIKTVYLDSNLRVTLWGEASKIEILPGMFLSARGKIVDNRLEVFDVDNVSVRFEFTAIEKLVPEKRVNLRGRVSGIGDVKFGREIYLSDATGRIKVVLWNCKDFYMKVDIGSCVEIINGIVKLSRRGEKEVHVDKNSSVRFCE
ncbi:MAG: OB-fold nucleic acid binding domain-containing protein [Archaeoglobales archaeon]|nr:OB-fold nucleic acid binding domain-containing protein [Archaeoglobales archaeon]